MKQDKDKKYRLVITILVIQTVLILAGFAIYFVPQIKLKNECNQYVDKLKGISSANNDKEFLDTAYKGCIEHKGGSAWEASIPSGN